MAVYLLIKSGLEPVEDVAYLAELGTATRYKVVMLVKSGRPAASR
jgi:hypothetical protein